MFLLLFNKQVEDAIQRTPSADTSRKLRLRQHFWCRADVGTCIGPAPLEQAPGKLFLSQQRVDGARVILGEKKVGG